MELTASGRTETGLRTMNQDRLQWWLDLGLFVVADGMGGHNGGEVASRLAVEVIHAFVAESSESPDITWPFGLDASCSIDVNRLTTAVRLANRRVLAEASRNPDLAGMGTTVVAALVTGDRAALVSVGDSRIYRWRNHTLSQLTQDDTWIATVLGREAAQAAEMTHPFRHVLTNVVGTTDDVKPNSREEILERGDTIVMCTDGIHGRLDQAALAGVLERANGSDQTATQLVDEAMDRGTSDNATALVISVQ